MLRKIVEQYADENNISVDEAEEKLRRILGVSLPKTLDEYNYLKYSKARTYHL